MGQSLDIIIPERLRERHWSGYHQTMKTGRSRYGDGDLLSVPGTRKDGSRVSLEFTIALLRDKTGAVTDIAAIMRDVTSRFEEMPFGRSLEGPMRKSCYLCALVEREM